MIVSAYSAGIRLMSVTVPCASTQTSRTKQAPWKKIEETTTWETSRWNEKVPRQTMYPAMKRTMNPRSSFHRDCVDPGASSRRMRVVGFVTQAPVLRKILGQIGWRFDPLKLPGRSPPMSEDFLPDPFPDYGPQ